MKFTTIIYHTLSLAALSLLFASAQAATVTIDFVDEDQFDGTDIMGPHGISPQRVPVAPTASRPTRTLMETAEAFSIPRKRSGPSP
jgi:hypothetical protein